MDETNFMISVVVPISDYKNSPQNIFDSIYHQTIGFNNIELIFVVDSSLINFNKALRDYSAEYSNVKVIFVNKKRNYSGELKNIGVCNSAADYIIFLENVDKLYDGAFKLLYDKIECNYDIVSGNWLVSASNDKKKNKWESIDLQNGEKVIRNLLENNEVFTFPSAISSKIFKKSIIDENNLKFPENVPCDDLVFLSEYLLKSRNILLTDECILEYSKEDDIWGSPIETESKDYLLGLMETYVELNYLFKPDNNLVKKLIYHLNYWFDLFIKSKLTIFERFEILKFSEFILKEFKDDLTSDFKLLADLVSQKRFYEASIFSNLLNKRLTFKNSNFPGTYRKLGSELDEFRQSVNDNSRKYMIDDKINKFANDLANFNIGLRIFDRFIRDYNNEDTFRALKLIKDWELFNKDFYIRNQGYDFDLDPLLHYICWGYKEGRKPYSSFDVIFYRDFYEDAYKSHLNPLVYFVLQGINKGEVKINVNKYAKPMNFVDKTVFEDKISNFNACGITETKRDTQLIVSLTSFPQRMYELHYTLYSLLNQDLKPDKVILWLAEDQFPNGEDDIPENVLNLKKNGLSIEWCDNISSYKKLIPSLEEYPDDIIVTADDDLFYPTNWLKTLYDEHIKYPDLIIAHRIRKIHFNDYLMSEYGEWDLSFDEEPPSFLNFSTNGAGTLFPPNSLYELVLDEELFKKLCPTADDVWIWAMAVLNDTKIKGVKNSYTKLTYVNLARELNMLNQKTLYSVNKMVGNNQQVENVLFEFPKILENIVKDTR
ncbi:glycosyltransferase family 2 protein [Methanobrevibacter sp.]|uniref:glycosyltransferase family 2 protein n=1 Tax=Methanobrevibacter sp. TaxID=66852 RepID=UPI003869C139